MFITFVSTYTFVLELAYCTLVRVVHTVSIGLMPPYNKFVVDRAFPWEECNSLCVATFCSWDQFQVRTDPRPSYKTSYCTLFTDRPLSLL